MFFEKTGPFFSRMPYKLRVGVLFAVLWTVALLGGTVFFSATDDRFFTWGPSDTRFAGIPISTWPRWAAVMTYSVLSQVAYSVVQSTVRPYISNVIRDHKTPPDEKGSMLGAQLLVQLYTLFHWAGSLFDVFLWITVQPQFIVPALLVDLILTAHFTRGYMTENRLLS